MKPGVTDISSDSESSNLIRRIADVEILYVLSSKPMSAKNLIEALKTTFELSISSGITRELLANLASEDKVAVFRRTGSSESASFDDIYGTTQRGLKLLKESVESLSEIVLTMQLGFNQKLLLA
jgi:DNA-binding PadR family transcriptional regulator